VICYLNGVAGTPTDITGVGLNDTPLVALGGFAAEGTWGFAGELGEIGLWKRVLAPADVVQLYNSGAGLSYPF